MSSEPKSLGHLRRRLARLMALPPSPARDADIEAIKSRISAAAYRVSPQIIQGPIDRDGGVKWDGAPFSPATAEANDEPANDSQRLDLLVRRLLIDAHLSFALWLLRADKRGSLNPDAVMNRLLAYVRMVNPSLVNGCSLRQLAEEMDLCRDGLSRASIEIAEQLHLAPGSVDQFRSAAGTMAQKFAGLTRRKGPITVSKPKTKKAA